jgi:2-keto-3-deoxy-L-rhamnonate aldolase RhmA
MPGVTRQKHGVIRTNGCPTVNIDCIFGLRRLVLVGIIGVAFVCNPDPQEEETHERGIFGPEGGLGDWGRFRHGTGGVGHRQEVAIVSRKPGKPAEGGAGKSHRPAIAFWLEHASLPACEIAALLGYNAVIFDMEHGVISPEAADHLTLSSKRLGLTVYSRVASADRRAIQHALDSGVDGVILPQIADLAHARAATAFAKYPPLGTRGVGYSRTMAYGGTGPDFFEAENRRALCFPMIETPGALAEVEAIACLETVDGLFIGPSDLSMTRGRGAYRITDSDLADLETIAAAAAKSGKPWALPAPSQTVFDFAVRQGAAMVTVCDDLTALRQGFTQGLAVAGRG